MLYDKRKNPHMVMLLWQLSKYFWSFKNRLAHSYNAKPFIQFGCEYSQIKSLKPAISDYVYYITVTQLKYVLGKKKQQKKLSCLKS